MEKKKKNLTSTQTIWTRRGITIMPNLSSAFFLRSSISFFFVPFLVTSDVSAYGLPCPA